MAELGFELCLWGLGLVPGDFGARGERRPRKQAAHRGGGKEAGAAGQAAGGGGAQVRTHGCAAYRRAEK